MKRLVLFLIAFSLFLGANAQIRDSFYGCKLGVTTKGQLLNHLKQLGHKCLYDKENKCYYIENVTFAGEQWGSCQFFFYKDTLYSVGFGIESDKGNVIDIYNRNIENVRTKYGKIEGKMICDEPNNKLCSFDDGITILVIDYKIKEGNFSTLIYQSKKLIKQMDEDAYNDI
ncbi:hypothetical protein [uncultured Prevotella sp.]|uniref:hypothetical protein n=1 Tax=uncultured Prevotella sp. TaxID=159272 RepID=UPI002608261C|nr:hypothetical protein [uncultured Prevotella sp.]